MGIQTRVRRANGGKSSSPSDDETIAALAARQHGVVGRRQVAALGIGHDAIDHRIALHRLHPLHRGVFAVGHTVVSREGAWLAAVLACGADAVLSHRSATALWGIRDVRQRDIDVIAPRRVERPRIAARHIVLPADEVTVHRRIPVTTVARTLFDLAGVLTLQQLETAITEAEGRRLTSPTSLADLVERHPRSSGTVALRRILCVAGEVARTVTRSELEIDLLVLVDAYGLPRPATNATIVHLTGEEEVDAVWRDARLIVELDSFGVHTTRRNFEADRARDRALTIAGWRVARFTWRQLHEHPDAVASELRALLGR